MEAATSCWLFNGKYLKVVGKVVEMKRARLEKRGEIIKTRLRVISRGGRGDAGRRHAIDVASTVRKKIGTRNTDEVQMEKMGDDVQTRWKKEEARKQETREKRN